MENSLPGKRYCLWLMTAKNANTYKITSSPLNSKSHDGIAWKQLKIE
jgi:hypothetical protein